MVRKSYKKYITTIMFTWCENFYIKKKGKAFIWVKKNGCQKIMIGLVFFCFFDSFILSRVTLFQGFIVYLILFTLFYSTSFFLFVLSCWATFSIYIRFIGFWTYYFLFSEWNIYKYINKKTIAKLVRYIRMLKQKKCRPINS